jgi:hydroxymethylpyrimidine pyrophosphatase-like HAD family hydrolase
MAEPPKISLVLADVDGTLVTEDKVLTKRAQAAVQHLHDVGILFAITSGRPPKGMAMLFDDLVDWRSRGIVSVIIKSGASNVAREACTVKFSPKVVADFAGQLDDVAKLVGVSDDHDTVQRCEADAQAAFGQRATASRSQPYYLDITHKDANKGAVVEYLSRVLDVSTGEIVTIGDQPNDVLMFKRSGFSIAMGNASDQVKAQASATTDSYNDEGFAKAMERFILDSTD